MRKPLTIYGETFDSRLLIGSALYPSPQIMQQSLVVSQSQIVTVSLRRQNSVEAGQDFWQLIKDTCLLYTSPSPRDRQKSRMPSSA